MGDDAVRVQVCHADGALKFPLIFPPKVRPTPRESVCMGVSRSVCGLRVRGEPVLCVCECVCAGRWCCRNGPGPGGVPQCRAVNFPVPLSRHRGEVM